MFVSIVALQFYSVILFLGGLCGIACVIGLRGL